MQNQYTIDDVFNVAGKNLANVLKASFNDDAEIVDWFYKPNTGYLFKGKSPYEFCSEDKNNHNKLEAALINLASGNLG